MTLNGKLDRSTLSLPGDQNKESHITKADNEVEQATLDIWSSVLPGTYGVTDDFQLLGGESINAAQIIHKIEQEFSVQISLQDFYRYSSVIKQAAFIQNMLLEMVSGDQALLDALSEIEAASDSENV